MWEHISAATAIVWGDIAQWRPIELHVEDIPGLGSAEVLLSVLPETAPESTLMKMRKTLDSGRLVEYAAIGLAGLALHYMGAHEIMDVTGRGSGADYLVGSDRHLLEVAGRSRKRDLPAAWNERLVRLSNGTRPFYLFVVEFETPSARFLFSES